MSSSPSQTRRIRNVLITGSSGYLGGTLLNRLTSTSSTANRSLDLDLPACNLFALVRNESQAESIRSLYGRMAATTVSPLQFDVFNADAVRAAVLDNNISVVYFLIDPVGCAAQRNLIRALGEVKSLLGLDVHFLHVSSFLCVSLFFSLSISLSSSFLVWLFLTRVMFLVSYPSIPYFPSTIR